MPQRSLPPPLVRRSWSRFGARVWRLQQTQEAKTRQLSPTNPSDGLPRRVKTK